MNVKAIPQGIRNNNPGNLRMACAPDTIAKKEGGYMKFASMQDGVRNLVWCIYNFYAIHELHTLRQFVARYAPATENDVEAYVRSIATMFHWSVQEADQADMRLKEPTNALRLAQCIIRQECGTKGNWPSPQGDWIDPHVILGIILQHHYWADAKP